MTVTVFEANDASAPELPASGNGGLITIMKACLINGYGTRTAAGGWTIQYEDAPNNKIVFKHPTESVYLRVDDNLHANYAEIYMYTAMTDIDTGTGRVPHVDELTNKNLVSKMYTTAVANRRWHMQVEDNSEWFSFWTHHTSYPAGFFFGKVYDLDGNPNWTISGYDSTTMTSSTAPRSWWTPDNATYHRQYNRWNADKSEKLEHQWPEESFQQPDPRTGKLLFTREYLRALTAPYIHYGYFPSRYISWGAVQNMGWSVHDKVTIGSDTYVVMVYQTYVFLMQYDTDAG